MKPVPRRIWAFDFDGTLSCLVPERHSAVLAPECEDLLRELSADPNQVVAVTSSRSLEDLESRVRLSTVVLSGASGLEWWIPGGHRLRPNHQASVRLARERERLAPHLGALQGIPGVEVEDKTWSAAVHFRCASSEQQLRVRGELERLREHHGLAFHYGPEVAEVPFLPETSKRLAVQTLIRLFGHKYNSRDLVYAGDDQNDATAMRWVLERKGLVYVVGHRIRVEGARVVDSPAELAKTIRQRTDAPWVVSGPAEV